jgi:dihydrofolate reductase
MTRPQIIAYVATSIDGFIAAKNGGVGWLDPYFTPELGFAGFLASIDTVLMGRNSYDQILGFGKWPYPGKTSFVVTGRLLSRIEGGSRTIAADPDAMLRALGEAKSRRVWAVGGAITFRGLFANGLVDELRLFIVPELLGDGKPLFLAQDRPARAHLVGERRFSNGIVELNYSFPR